MSQFYVQQLVGDEDAGLGAFDWQNLIGQGFQFGNNFLSAKYGKDAAKYQALAAAAAPAAAAATTTTAPTAAEEEAALKAKATGSGFYLGQTFIPWSYVVAGGGIFALIQMTGFSRKGR